MNRFFNEELGINLSIFQFKRSISVVLVDLFVLVAKSYKTILHYIRFEDNRLVNVVYL